MLTTVSNDLTLLFVTIACTSISCTKYVSITDHRVVFPASLTSGTSNGTKHGNRFSSDLVSIPIPYPTTTACSPSGTCVSVLPVNDPCPILYQVYHNSQTITRAGRLPTQLRIRHAISRQKGTPTIEKRVVAGDRGQSRELNCSRKCYQTQQNIFCFSAAVFGRANFQPRPMKC